MQTIPKVSVLIPTYNYAHFLDDAIQSVLNQSFIDFELLIVDNCSTDNTAEVVKKYLSDSRVSFYRNETNLGLVGNWNRCLNYAKGTYIKFLCADDTFHPQLLEKFVAVMDTHPTVAVTGSYDEVFGDKSFCRMSRYKGLTSGRHVRTDLAVSWNKLRNPSVVMFRKKDVDAVGTFNPQLLKYTDKEYYIRLLSRGDYYIIPEVLSFIRSHSSTQSTLIRKKEYQQIFERYRFTSSVKKAGLAEVATTGFEIDAELKNRAIRCAAVLYEVLPKLYRKENRTIFKTAFQIGYSEKVLLAPIAHYLQLGYIRRLVRRKRRHS